MKVQMTLDRIEGETAVCLTPEETVYTCPRACLAGIAEGDRFEAEIKDGVICHATALPDVSKQKRTEHTARLRALFARRKEGNRK